jgi:hypothetical protein
MGISLPALRPQREPRKTIRRPMPSDGRSGISAKCDGTVVVGSDDSYVYFIDPDQSDEWSAATASGGTP